MNGKKERRLFRYHSIDNDSNDDDDDEEGMQSKDRTFYFFLLIHDLIKLFLYNKIST